MIMAQPNLYLSESLFLIVGLSFNAVQPWRYTGTAVERLANVTEFCAETGKSIPNDIPPTTKDEPTSAHSHHLPGDRSFCTVLVRHIVDTMTPFRLSLGLLVAPQPVRMRRLLIHHLAAVWALPFLAHTRTAVMDSGGASMTCNSNDSTPSRHFRNSVNPR